MALTMPKLTRCSKTGDWISRKVIPVDVKPDYQRVYGVRSEALFRAPGKVSGGEAKRLYGDWLGEVESRIETFRATRKGIGRTLSQREAAALAGDWYRWFTSQHEENPGDKLDWLERFGTFVDEISLLEPKERWTDPLDNSKYAWTKAPHVRPKVRPVVYEFSEAERFLTSKGIHLQPAALDLFLDALESVMIQAFSLLERRASGDFGADTMLTKLPAFEPKRLAGADAWSLWESWITERQPAAQTRDRWRAVFLDLKSTFEARDANTITEDEARKWATGLITESRSAQTVSEVWLGAAKTVFSWAKDAKRIDQNPFRGIKITIPRKTRHRETKAFTAGEALTILEATLSEPPARLAPHYIAARRWVPWLCAYSGARVGEITQLRGIDVFERDGVWALRLTPEAGTIKSGEARVVPIHEHLVEQGFLEFVRKAGKGPLFYDPHGRRKTSEEDPTKPGQSQARKTANKLGEWVREIGVDDSELRPNHAWRHTFKQIADRCGISERVSDVVTGHAPQTVARSYGQPTLIDMAEALRRFPRYETREGQVRHTAHE
jgi:integrase